MNKPTVDQIHVAKLTFALFLLIQSWQLKAQITITNADMPNVNDAIVLSIQPTLTNFKPSLTGPNYTWDYRFLIPDSQRVEKMFSPASTSYPFFTFISTYAIPNYNPDLFPFVFLGSQPTNAYNFFKKQSSQLTMSAQGITTGGSPLPILLSPPDVIYKFPLQYGNKDSSISGYGNAVPGLGYFRKKQKRVNTVDGWGVLTTPYGTFNTLRVKSVITVTDSIYFDSLGFGINIPLPTTYEFKWLAQGGKLPVLEIDASGPPIPIGSALVITNVAFQDSLLTDMNLSINAAATCPSLKQGSLQVVVKGGRSPYTYSWSNGGTTSAIDHLAAGTYTITVKDSYRKTATAFATVELKENDPACLNIPNGFTPDNDGVNDVWNIRGLDEFKNCKVEIFNHWGSLIFNSKGYTFPWEGKYNNQPVEAGTYYYVIDLGNGRDKYTGTITIIK